MRPKGSFSNDLVKSGKGYKTEGRGLYEGLGGVKDGVRSMIDGGVIVVILGGGGGVKSKLDQCRIIRRKILSERCPGGCSSLG